LNARTFLDKHAADYTNNRLFPTPNRNQINPNSVSRNIANNLREVKPSCEINNDTITVDSHILLTYFVLPLKLIGKPERNGIALRVVYFYLVSAWRREAAMGQASHLDGDSFRATADRMLDRKI
jgi:hypothetical protein